MCKALDWRYSVPLSLVDPTGLGSIYIVLLYYNQSMKDLSYVNVVIVDVSQPNYDYQCDS